MDFDKFKRDITMKIDREFASTSFDRNARELQKVFNHDVINLVCKILEEYDKRKNEE